MGEKERLGKKSIEALCKRQVQDNHFDKHAAICSDKKKKGQIKKKLKGGEVKDHLSQVADLLQKSTK